MFENIPHNDLMAWVFWLCLLIAIFTGSTLALKIYEKVIE